MQAQSFAKLAGALFLVIAALHLLRLWLGWSAVFGGWTVPMWLSWVALLVGVFLGVTGLRSK